MAMPQNDIWFRPGRLEKSGRRNPGNKNKILSFNDNDVLGILAVDNQYEFTSQECTKDGTEWVYCCKYRQTVKVKCPARVRVLRHVVDIKKC